MGFLHGRRALIVDVANQRSIAWGIANAMYREGARPGITGEVTHADAGYNMLGMAGVSPFDQSIGHK